MIVENSGLLTVAALKHLDCKGKKRGLRPLRRQHGRDHHVLRCAARPDPAGPHLHRIGAAARPSRRAGASGDVPSPSNNGNVIKLDHNQFVTTNRNAAVELRVTIEAYGEDHKQQIVEALAAAGFTPQIVLTQL